MPRKNPVGKTGTGNTRYPSGMCWVIIPGGIDRGDYIQNSYRKGTISCLFEDGSFMTEVPVGLSILKDIDFPAETEQLGSQLVYVNMPLHNQPIIVDRVLKDDESTNFVENEFKLQKFTDSGSVTISGIAKKGNLFLNVEGRSSGGGKIFINATNPNNDAAVVVNVKGSLEAEIRNIIMNILEEINVVCKNDINVTSKEGDINVNPETDGKKVNLGTGNEPILLGNITQEQLYKLQTKVDLIITAINDGVPVAQDGGAAYQQTMVAILQAAQDADFSNIKSEKSFTQ